MKHKQLITTAGLALATVACPAHADFMITGYLDGTTGGTARIMELYALNDITDLNDYTIQIESNGGDPAVWNNAIVTWNDFTGPVTAGSFFYIVSSPEDKTDLEAVFGVGAFDPSEITGGLSGTGNDAFRIIRESDSAVIDTFGDPLDPINPSWGDGYAWEHQDGWVYRNSGTGPDGETFNLANWDIQTDGEDADFPLGTFVFSTGAVIGDTDGDGDVDDADLGTSFANYTGPGGVGKTVAEGDTDNDGDVDDGDLGASFAAYTGPLGPAVPEPASLLLLGLGGLALNTRRHRPMIES